MQLKERYAHQIIHVLRLGPGDGFIVLDNAGNEYDVELSMVKADSVVGQIKAQRTCVNEPKVRLILFQSLLKRDKFEWILQKCTEVGVARIVPVISHRSLVQKTPIKPGKLDRWQAILKEASEQCERSRIPVLDTPISFSDSLKEMETVDLGLIASPQSNNPSLATVLTSLNTSKPPHIGIWIGPEGGFDLLEKEKAIYAGATCVSLGKHILKTETAAVVASALILHELNEL